MNVFLFYALYLLINIIKFNSDNIIINYDDKFDYMSFSITDISSFLEKPKFDKL